MAFPDELRIEEIQRKSAIHPAELQIFFNKPPRLWCVGDVSLLDNKLLGIVSARRIEPDLALATLELLQQLASLEITFISGWHSPLEEEALRILLTQPVRIIFCLAKSLNKFLPLPEIKSLLNEGRALVITHCSPKAKRISRDASLRRNHLVIALAKAVLVLSAPDGSASFKLAKAAIGLGKPVFTPEHRVNDGLLASGALPATFENIQKVLQ
ncbi:MAG: DNA-processing protein DprA [Deltaproteobacteria bacterium]|nr:DNA-processing protein DprA [Deltaproteobacteria bacterium]